MPFPFIPAAVVALTGLTAWQIRKKPSGLTPEREAIYVAALRSLKDPVKLRALATSFDAEGLKVEAELLRKRASLRDLPPETKKARRESFKKGMSSKDADGVEKLALAFESQGASGAAAALKEYAEGLRKVGPEEKPPTEKPTP
jgi:hypothetical protein